MGARTWGLAQVFTDDEAAIAAARSLVPRAAALGELAESGFVAERALELVRLMGELEADLEQVHDFARMRQYGDAVGEGVQTLVAVVGAVVTDVRAEIESVLDAWRALDEGAAAEIAADPALAEARYRLERGRALTPHRLPPAAERAWSARTESARDRWSSLQEQVEAAVRVPFDDGTGSRAWGLGDLSTVLRRPEPELRASAYAALAEGISSIADVLAIAWDAAVADRLAEDRLRGREHPAQETLDDEDLSLDGFRSLVEVAASGYGERRTMLRILGETLGVAHLAVCDADAAPPGLPQLDYEGVVELGIRAQESLALPLGAEARLLVDHDRIDAETRPGKQAYAATFGSRLTPPAFVAFRFTGQAANVLLLGHELGHAVALARAAAARSPIARGWPGVIFEVPSLAGELAAGDVFAETSPEHAHGIRLVAAQDLAWSVFESIAFCQAELDLYAVRAGGTVLDADVIQAAFAHRFGELYEPDVPFREVDACVAMGGWAGYAIPSRFYNFQYSVGALVALALSAQRREDPERFGALYLELLDRGRSASPAAQLTPFGLEPSRGLWECGLAELRRRFALLAQPS